MSDPFKAPLVPDATHASRASVPVATTAAATSSQARPPPIGPIGLLRQALSRLIESKVFYFDPFSEKVRQKSEEIRTKCSALGLKLPETLSPVTATHVILDADCERSAWLREVRADQAALSLQWAAESFAGGNPANEDSYRLTISPRNNTLASGIPAPVRDAKVEEGANTSPDLTGEDGEEELSESDGSYDDTIEDQSRLGRSRVSSGKLWLPQTKQDYAQALAQNGGSCRDAWDAFRVKHPDRSVMALRQEYRRHQVWYENEIQTIKDAAAAENEAGTSRRYGNGLGWSDAERQIVVASLAASETENVAYNAIHKQLPHRSLSSIKNHHHFHASWYARAVQKSREEGASSDLSSTTPVSAQKRSATPTLDGQSTKKTRSGSPTTHSGPPSSHHSGSSSVMGTRKNPFGPVGSTSTSTSTADRQSYHLTRDESQAPSASTRASSHAAAPRPGQASSASSVAVVAPQRPGPASPFFEPRTFLLPGVPPTSCWWCGLVGSPSYRTIEDAYLRDSDEGRNVLVRLDSGQACAGCAAFHVRELSSADNGAGMSERMVQATRKLMDRAVEIRGRSVKKEEGK